MSWIRIGGAIHGVVLNLFNIRTRALFLLYFNNVIGVLYVNVDITFSRVGPGLG